MDTKKQEHEEEMVVTVIADVSASSNLPKTVHFTEAQLNELSISSTELANLDDEKRKSLAYAMQNMQNEPEAEETKPVVSVTETKTERWPRIKRRLDSMLGPWAGNPACHHLFPSSESIKNEQQRQKRVNRYIVHPNSFFRVVWDFGMVVVLLVTMIVLPVEIAFYSEDLWAIGWKVFNLSIDFLFLCDICVNFRTGYVKDDECVLDNKKIIKYYLLSWFLPDFISSVSFDYIVLGITNSSVIASTLRALRMVKFISLLRLFRFVRLVRYLDKINEFWDVDAKVLSIFKLIMLILVFAHWNACIQYLVAFIQGFPDYSWVVIADLQHANVTVWSRYTHALYRGMSHMISIGYGWTPPNGDAETWMVILSMMTGASFYALFIAHMSSVVMSLDTSGRRFNEKVCEVQEYMRYRRMPAKLQRRVLDYYEYKYQQKYFDEHDIVNERHMSYPLRKEILMHNCRSLVESVPFLSSAPSEFLVDVILKLVMHIYFPGEYVVQAGKKGDSMYFIEHGAVNIVLPTGEMVNTLKDGTHFGEISLLFVEKRIADVVAVERCYIYRLSKSDFEDVLNEYPQMRTVMLDVARERMRETHQLLGFDPDKYREKIRPVHVRGDSESTIGQLSSIMTSNTTTPREPEEQYDGSASNTNTNCGIGQSNINNSNNDGLMAEPNAEEKSTGSDVNTNASNGNDVHKNKRPVGEQSGGWTDDNDAEPEGGELMRKTQVIECEAAPQHSQSDISVETVRRRHLCRDQSLPDVSM